MMTITAWLVAMFLTTARNCVGHRYKDYRSVAYCWECGLRKDAIETSIALGLQ